MVVYPSCRTLPSSPPQGWQLESSWEDYGGAGLWPSAKRKVSWRGLWGNSGALKKCPTATQTICTGYSRKFYWDLNLALLYADHFGKTAPPPKTRKWVRKRMEFPSLSQQNRDLKAPGLNWNKWVHYISFNLYLHVLHSEFKQWQSPKTPLLWEESEFKMTMDLWVFSQRKLTWILPFYLLKNYILVPVSICC